MIEIRSDNYEIYALDFIEGKLDSASREAFEEFLLLHPEVAAEMEDLAQFTVELEEENFNSENLKKGALLSEDLNLDNAELYFTAYHEGDLTKQEKDKVADFLKHHPDKKNDFIQLGLLRFQADSSIQFPLKRQTKKAVPLFYLRSVYRIAAILLLAFALGIFLLNPKEEMQVYSERSGKVEFPEKTGDDFDDQFEKQIKLVENPLNEEVEGVKIQNPNPNSQQELIASTLKDNPREPERQPDEFTALVEENLGEETLIGEEVLAVANAEEETEEPTGEELVFQPISLGIEEEPLANKGEIIPPTIIEIPSGGETESQSILKFKRPFKGQNKEDELLANNDSETILKIANPLKRKRSISFGPIKVKKK